MVYSTTVVSSMVVPRVGQSSPPSRFNFPPAVTNRQQQGGVDRRNGVVSILWGGQSKTARYNYYLFNYD
jgi:hypothetical protein